MSDTGLDVSAMDETLHILMNQLKPSQMRPFWRKLAIHFRAKNRTRIRANQNADGSAYTPRKDRSNSKKMLTGFSKAKYLKYQVKAEHVVIGIMGAGSAAYIHHLGQIEDGIRYPARELIGLPEEDKQEALDMLNEYVAEIMP